MERARGTAKEIAQRYQVSADALHRHLTTHQSRKISRKITRNIAEHNAEASPSHHSANFSAIFQSEPAPAKACTISTAAGIVAKNDGDTEQESADSCHCDWCQLSPYRRLKRAWEETTEMDHGRLSVEIAPYDVPF